jgi:hypothetical protein
LFLRYEGEEKRGSLEDTGTNLAMISLAEGSQEHIQAFKERMESKYYNEVVIGSSETTG